MRASDIWQVDFPLEAEESKVQPARQKLLPRPGWVACRNEEKTKSHASLRVRCTDISVLAGCISAGAIVSPASRPASECNKIVIVSPPQGLIDAWEQSVRVHVLFAASVGNLFRFSFFFPPSSDFFQRNNERVSFGGIETYFSLRFFDRFRLIGLKRICRKDFEDLILKFEWLVRRIWTFAPISLGWFH